MFNWSLTTFRSENNNTYKLERYEYNYMLIFNHFDVGACHKVRVGTDMDVNSLESTFSQVGFEIDVHDDLTKTEIMDKLSILRDKDFTDYGCVAVVVLTHGGDGGTLMAKDGRYNEKEIIEYFKIKTNHTLIGKPKILIIQIKHEAAADEYGADYLMLHYYFRVDKLQNTTKVYNSTPMQRVWACRGNSIEQSVGVGRTWLSSSPDNPDVSYFLTLDPDILVLHSSYPGHPSFRMELLGSWFIQLLCYEIARCSPILDLESIFTNVKRKIAIFFARKEINPVTGEYELNKQMPVSTSTLTKKLYLRKYKDYVQYDSRNLFLKAESLCYRDKRKQNKRDPDFVSLLFSLR